LQPSSHVLGKHTQSDRGKVVDGESRVLRVVFGEDTRQCRLQVRFLEPRSHLFDSHLLHDFLHEDLDEDSARRRRFLLVHVDEVKDSPRYSIGSQEMAEESTDIPQFVGFVTMNGVVVFGKSLLEVVTPHSTDFAESFTDEAVKLGVRSLLRTTFNNHVTELNLHNND
jgi:hypothetical protein